MKKLLILLLLLCLCVPASAETDLQQAYEAALQLEAEEDVGGAAEAFLALGDYKDSVHHYKKNRAETIWAELMDLVRQGDFRTARQMAEPFYAYFDESMQASCDEWVLRSADRMGPFNEWPTALFDVDGQMGIMTATFKQVTLLSPQIQLDSPLPLLQDGLLVQRDPESGLLGYLDVWGQWAIKPQFDEAGVFHQGQALTKKGSAYFVFNDQGKLLSALPKGREYLEALGEGLISFREKGLVGAVDMKGKVVIKAKYQTLSPFTCGYATATLPKKNAAALLNPKGKEVIKAGKYAELKVLNENYILAAKKAGDLPGILTLKGKAKAPMGSLTFHTRQAGDLIITQGADLLMGLLDKNLKQLLPNQYADIQVGTKSRIVALKENGLYRLYPITDLNTPLTSDFYTDVSLDPNSIFLTVRSQKLGWHLLDENGNLIH